MLRFTRLIAPAAAVACLLVPAALPGAGIAARPIKAGGIDTKALLHDSWSVAYRTPFGAAPAGTAVTVRFRTSHAGATAVTAMFRYVDPRTAKAGTRTSQAMKLGVKGKKYDLWRTVFTPKDIGVYNYVFLVKKGATSAWYGSSLAFGGGVGVAYKANPKSTYSITSYDPNFKAVSWAANAVIYQIFPDRFFNGDPSNDSLNRSSPDCGGPTFVHASESENPTGSCDFFGGDLQGIVDKLSYLKDLGINTLYLNPIFFAASNHKYDTADYYRIDPHFGALDTFNSLVQQAHAMGFHLILDGVFNHTGADSVYFNKYGSLPGVGAYQSKSSPFYPLYTFTSWPNVYASFFGISSLPQLAETDQTKDFIFRTPDSVAQHWLAAGADGWRLDATHLKSHQWWTEFRQSVKTRFPDAILICECDLAPIDALPWLLGGEVDGAMNYRFRHSVLSFFSPGAVGGMGYSASSLFKDLMTMREEYPLAAIYSSMNLVDSHDTDRILDSVGNSVPELEQVATFQMTWIGAPTIEYGDEAGLTGSGSDPLRRKFFPWSHPNTTLQAFYKKIIGIRNANSALRDGSISPLVFDNVHRTLAFLRVDSSQSVAVAVNDGPSSVKVTLTLSALKSGTKLTDGITGKTYTVKNHRVTVSLKGKSSAILAQAQSG
jgi:cyclomaltodextrinase / maltogenic alpha-amylase / neopullulanase